ncbi:putative RNA-directed DNA polymerase from transposon BS [Stylophora pistillata]|uniref:Putative RNA-directed DNA polymerase from transposon BS n=1 Tax=Stylophora pistillata TaxID=50429 RepID=A0A2B4SM75_STYPI|nr:putative RNA-directed DNA polymerase from transposon BS [Stylophora pistillata]
MKYLTDFQLLNDNQQGFRPSRSCVTQLLQLVHEWLQAMDKLGSVDAVFLDFAKALDKVSHAHVPYKLECYGIKDQILSWLRDFLTSRKQRVVIEGQASDWLSVTPEVPQGSKLGPLLFLVYINDLPYSVTYNSDLVADDAVLHCHIRNRLDCDLLQEDLSSTSEWSSRVLGLIKRTFGYSNKTGIKTAFKALVLSSRTLAQSGTLIW